MQTKGGYSSFSFALAAAGGILGIAAGMAGAFGGIIPGIIVAAIEAALLGFFGKALCAASGKRAALARTADGIAGPGPDIPADRIDTLTGLANANGLAAWFSEKEERLSEDGKGIFVLLADLDKADEIERLRGKETAEAVIKEVAKRVSGFAGPDGIAARTGNEFVAVAAVVPGKALEIAEESAGKLAEIICRPVDLGGGTIWIGGAVGAAVGSPRDGEAILGRAKLALGKARALGLGRFWVDGLS